jgi:hypothetical protein
MGLPDAFCWTRVGAEAGQLLPSILKRKETERVSNGGVFLWGIGNAIAPSLRQLLVSYPSPALIFSPIKSPPKHSDASPSLVAYWTRAEDLDGNAYELPRYSLVTSRYSVTRRVPVHYALVCSSVAPLAPAAQPLTFDIADVENFLTKKRVGASQVTAVVRYRKTKARRVRTYNVILRARLTWPYFVMLRDPVVLPNSPDSNWESVVTDMWTDILRRPAPADTRDQPAPPL